MVVKVEDSECLQVGIFDTWKCATWLFATATRKGPTQASLTTDGRHAEEHMTQQVGDAVYPELGLNPTTLALPGQKSAGEMDVAYVEIACIVDVTLLSIFAAFSKERRARQHVAASGRGNNKTA